jgi:hypothetical protein
MRKSKRVSGILYMCSALNCIHVEMELLGRARSTDYFDKDKNYSYVIQEVVETNM